MRTSAHSWGGPELLILAGSCMFIFILVLSAYFEADIRWLHFFQAWMYVATMALSLHHDRWGYFIGMSVAGFWNYINLCVTTFFRNGLHWLTASLAAGQIQHVDQIIAVPAWLGNLLVIVGCIWAYGRLPEKNPRDWMRFVLAFVLTQLSSPQIFGSSNRGTYRYFAALSTRTRHLLLCYFHYVGWCEIRIALKIPRPPNCMHLRAST